MSKKINIVLLCINIVLLIAPFFEVQSADKSNIYINASSLFPIFQNMGNEHYNNIRTTIGSNIYLLFLIIPLAEIALISISMRLKSAKIELLAYLLNFVGFVFAIFSLHGFENYKLSFGYFGILFVYLLIFAIKLLEYLITSSPSERELFK